MSAGLVRQWLARAEIDPTVELWRRSSSGGPPRRRSGPYVHYDARGYVIEACIWRDGRPESVELYGDDDG